MGALSLARVRPARLRQTVQVPLVESSREALDFFACQLEAYLPVHVENVLRENLPAVMRRQEGTGSRAAVLTSFFHLSEVERLVGDRGLPIIPLLAKAHLDTFRRLAHLPAGTRVGVVSAESETAHSVRHSIASGDLPNIALVGAFAANGPPWKPCFSRMGASCVLLERVRQLANGTIHVIIDERAVDTRAIEKLTAILIRHDAAMPTTAPEAGPQCGRGKHDVVLVGGGDERRTAWNSVPMCAERGEGAKAGIHAGEPLWWRSTRGSSQFRAPDGSLAFPRGSGPRPDGLGSQNDDGRATNELSVWAFHHHDALSRRRMVGQGARGGERGRRRSARSGRPLEKPIGGQGRRGSLLRPREGGIAPR